MINKDLSSLEDRLVYLEKNIGTDLVKKINKLRDYNIKSMEYYFYFSLTVVTSVFGMPLYSKGELSESDLPIMGGICLILPFTSSLFYHVSHKLAKIKYEQLRKENPEKVDLMDEYQYKSEKFKTTLYKSVMAKRYFV